MPLGVWGQSERSCFVFNDLGWKVSGADGVRTLQTLLLNDGSLRDPSMWHTAAVGAALVAWFSRSVGYTLGAGMALLWVLEALPGL